MGLRLLPWTGPDGKPAYTPDDNPGGILAQIADRVEDEHLEQAQRILDLLTGVLDAGAGTRPVTEPTRVLLGSACEALGRVLRVAESRGMRLPACVDDEPVDDGVVGDGPVGPGVPDGG
ncbi:hypothetical protein ABZ479_34570 [Streptomyces sp. NPDC005722]